jgi:hypothetical protein
VQSRVHTRDVLLRKCIVTADEASCPLCPEKLETASHMAFHCPAVSVFWSSLGVSIPRDAHVRDLHLLPMPPAIAPETAPAFVLCCWHIWKQRNMAVFQATPPSMPLLLKVCRDDATLWRGRFPVETRAAFDVWHEILRGQPM